MNEEKTNLPELEALRKDLDALNNRLAKVESLLLQLKGQRVVPGKSELPEEEAIDIKFPFQSKGSIEYGIGEYGMAWIGNIVLFFGLIFLVNYLQNSGSSLTAAAVGFCSVALVYVSSYYTRKSLSVLSKLLVFNGHLLLYFFTLRLHFFQETPLIQNKILGFILPVVVSAVILYIAFRKESQFTAVLSLLMLIATGVFYDVVGVVSGVAAIAAALTVFLYYRFGWIKLTFAFIFIIYLAHLTWLLNDPFMGHNPEFIASPGSGYVYFIATGFIFSFLALIPKREEVSNEFIISSIIWNGIGFTILLAAIVVTYFAENYVPIFSAITVLCILWAVILKLRSQIKIIASMYVLYGFLALSVAIFGILGLPKSYGLFALQSLLVVSFALWFRSRFMIIMNTILFLVLLIFFIQSKSFNDLTNFAYMLVAFISARIINWKKKRLNIKTEFVRDIYLVAGFAMTLVAFYHVSPPSYITASWIFAGILFFLMSLLIKNIKYRWLAIATMVVSAIRLIFFDMASVNIGYRVLVFLGLAIISITVSIMYTKYLVKKKE
ncbi:hypothetical protein [Maribellus sediminis]|uniref:hypothetical protein n=1 Tax=Maribellus sediminis TaxID=2696285 RepID=UPI00142F9485|nr:hypothetical protein [Maribellus sediminis]